MDVVGRYWYNGGSGNSANGDDSLGSAKVSGYPHERVGPVRHARERVGMVFGLVQSAPAGALIRRACVGLGRVLRGGS